MRGSAGHGRHRRGRARRFDRRSPASPDPAVEPDGQLVQADLPQHRLQLVFEASSRARRRLPASVPPRICGACGAHAKRPRTSASVSVRRSVPSSVTHPASGSRDRRARARTLSCRRRRPGERDLLALVDAQVETGEGGPRGVGIGQRDVLEAQRRTRREWCRARGLGHGRLLRAEGLDPVGGVPDALGRSPRGPQPAHRLEGPEDAERGRGQQHRVRRPNATSHPTSHSAATTPSAGTPSRRNVVAPTSRASARSARSSSVEWASRVRRAVAPPSPLAWSARPRTRSRVSVPKAASARATSARGVVRPSAPRAGRPRRAPAGAPPGRAPASVTRTPYARRPPCSPAPRRRPGRRAARTDPAARRRRRGSGPAGRRRGHRPARPEPAGRAGRVARHGGGRPVAA